MAQKWEEREWQYYREVVERFDLGRGSNSTIGEDGKAGIKHHEAEAAREL